MKTELSRDDWFNSIRPTICRIVDWARLAEATTLDLDSSQDHEKIRLVWQAIRQAQLLKPYPIATFTGFTQLAGLQLYNAAKCHFPSPANTPNPEQTRTTSKGASGDICRRFATRRKWQYDDIILLPRIMGHSTHPKESATHYRSSNFRVHPGRS